MVRVCFQAQHIKYICVSLFVLYEINYTVEDEKIKLHVFYKVWMRTQNVSVMYD